MELSKLPIDVKWNPRTKLYDNKFDKDTIYQILYEGIKDDNTSCRYAIVFGISRIIEMRSRVQTAYKLYKNGRIKKVIFTGSAHGISSKEKNQTPKEVIESCEEVSKLFEDDLTESERMKKYAIELGIKEEDIIIDTKSNDSIETFINLNSLLHLDKEDSLILITSGYHMRRCLLGSSMYISPNIHYCPVVARTGYFEEDNFYKTDMGYLLANFDANNIIRQIRDKKLPDMEYNMVVKKN